MIAKLLEVVSEVRAGAANLAAASGQVSATDAEPVTRHQRAGRQCSGDDVEHRGDECLDLAERRQQPQMEQMASKGRRTARKAVGVREP